MVPEWSKAYKKWRTGSQNSPRRPRKAPRMPKWASKTSRGAKMTPKMVPQGSQITLNLAQKVVQNQHGKPIWFRETIITVFMNPPDPKIPSKTLQKWHPNGSKSHHRNMSVFWTIFVCFWRNFSINFSPFFWTFLGCGHECQHWSQYVKIIKKPSK